jgi:hypothetical protein
VESEIRTARRVDKQLIVEILKQHLSAISCMWMHVVMEDESITCLCSEWTYADILVFCNIYLNLL